MSIEGRLTIDIYRAGRSVERVEISSSRPREVARVFENKPVDTVLDSIPLLFNVCAIAQARAAAQAGEQALGTPQCHATEAARDCLVFVETAREHLMRIALDWPAFLNEEVEKRDLVQIPQLLPAMANALFASSAPFARGARARTDASALETVLADCRDIVCSQALGEPAERFLERHSAAELEAWSSEGRTCAARLVRTVIDRDWASAATSDGSFLPELEDEVLAGKLDAGTASDFTARPTWDGIPRETSALSRRRHHPLLAGLLAQTGPGLLARLAARLVELAELPGQIERRAQQACDPPVAAAGVEASTGNGAGLAQVEAARGRLVHAIRIAEGKVARYRILAPTEWNFHPQGVAAQALTKLNATDAASLETQARLLIDAVDPCVGYEVRVH